MRLLIYIILIVMLLMNNYMIYKIGFCHGLEVAKEVIDETMKDKEEQEDDKV